jgi:hypothetical protein
MYVIFLLAAEVHVEAPPRAEPWGPKEGPRACPTVSEVLARKVDSVQQTTIPQFLPNLIRASNSFVLAVNDGARAEPSFDGNKFGELNQ